MLRTSIQTIALKNFRACYTFAHNRPKVKKKNRKKHLNTALFDVFSKRFMQAQEQGGLRPQAKNSGRRRRS